MRKLYPARLRQGRSPRGNSPPSLSLFPFLAVLISTMGILILLIVVIVRQSRREASQLAAAQQEQVRKELEANLELLDWQAGVLRQALEVGQEKIQSLRDILAHVEEHTRRLIDRREALLAASRLQKGVLPRGAEAEKIREELARLEEEIRRLRAEIEDLARRPERKRRYYSIVPYGGPFGSNRRPIYLECRQDTIVLQPEGITFVPQDFEGDLGPGNPLDTAIRAIREYHIRYGLGSEEPYPLFVVRPGGISGYYVARAALERWGGEFGYELVEEDWQIVYPEPNAHLAKEVTAAVELSRARTRASAQVGSRRWANAPRRFVVSPDGGGLVAESGGALRGNVSPFSRGIGKRENTGEPARQLLPGGRGESETSPAAGLFSEENSPKGTVEPVGPFDAQLPVVAGEEGAKHLPDQGKYSSQNGAASGTARWPGGPNGLPVAEPSAAGVVAAPLGGAVFSGRDSSGEMSGVSGPGRSSRSLAVVRGPNWALPPGSGVLVPLWRPVRILCTEEYVVLEPEEGLGSPVMIPWHDPPEKTIDELVRAVWEYVERWGPAGRGMGWRPQLKVRVASGGETRCHVLSELLDGSGLSLEIVR